MQVAVLVLCICTRRGIFLVANLIEGNPPFAHDMTCSTDKFFPQVHFDGLSEDPVL